MENISYLLPEAKSVLILAPHPDDETLGCGGTIALYALKGVDVHVAIISDGAKIAHEFADENVNIVEARKQEVVESAKILGIKQTYFLDFPDGELPSYKNEIRIRIEDIIKIIHPDIIFAPSPIDFHQDHIATSDIALQIKRGFPLKLAYYEVYNTMRFNTLIDITEVMHIKEKAFLNYKYSLFNCPDLFFNAVKGMNIFRSFYTRKQRYYEAFYIVSETTDKAEIINWLTYDMKEEDPAILFLSKLKAVDELLLECRKYDDLLRAKEVEVIALKEAILKNGKSIKELKMQLKNINDSLIWKFATRFYSLRDRIMPEDSLPRKIYDKILMHIKANLK